MIIIITTTMKTTTKLFTKSEYKSSHWNVHFENLMHTYSFICLSSQTVWNAWPQFASKLKCAMSCFKTSMMSNDWMRRVDEKNTDVYLITRTLVPIDVVPIKNMPIKNVPGQSRTRHSMQCIDVIIFFLLISSMYFIRSYVTILTYKLLS